MTDESRKNTDVGLDNKAISRRQFLKFAGLAGGTIVAAGGLGGLIAACGEATTTTTAGPATTSGPGETSVTTGASDGSAKVIKIGAIETLTGPASDVLKIVADGDLLAQDYVNNVRGGVKINGETYKLEVIVRDNKMSTEGAVASANELIFDQKVNFMVGSMPPFLTMAINSVTEPNKVLYMCPLHTGTKAELNETTPYKFITSPCNYSQQRDTLARLHEEHPDIKKVSYILVDDGCIADNEPVVAAAAEELGLELGKIVGWTLDTVDFTATVTKALAQKPEAVMTGNGSTDMTGSVLKIAREQGFTGPIVANNSNPPQDVLTIAGSMATNWSGHGITDDFPGLPEFGKTIAGLAVEKYGRLDIAHPAGFDSIYLLVQGIEAAQSLDANAVREALEKMDTAEAMLGASRMGGTETYGLKNHVLYTPKAVIYLEDGKMVLGGWRSPYMP